MIPAAGAGARMGGVEKQFLDLGGRPVLVRTLEVFEGCPKIAAVWVVVAPNRVRWARDELLPRYSLTKLSGVVEGGPERQVSVLRGLQAMGTAADGVVIHDAARPFLPPQVLERALEEAERAPAVVVGVPVADTVKVVKDGVIAHTPDRATLWAAQTPQIFRRDLILEAHRRAAEEGYQATDDADLVERLGVAVRMVEGSPLNRKLTTPDELLWAQSWLERRG